MRSENNFLRILSLRPADSQQTVRRSDLTSHYPGLRAIRKLNRIKRVTLLERVASKGLDDGALGHYLSSACRVGPTSRRLDRSRILSANQPDTLLWDTQKAMYLSVCVPVPTGY
jgi:hypothetical protein